MERADRWPLQEPRSRYLVVTDVPDGVATIRNPATGQGVELRWDAAVLPHVWIWHEVRTYGGIWRGCAEILAVEPASSRTGWAWRRRCARSRRWWRRRRTADAVRWCDRRCGGAAS